MREIFEFKMDESRTERAVNDLKEADPRNVVTEVFDVKMRMCEPHLHNFCQHRIKKIKETPNHYKFGASVAFTLLDPYRMSRFIDKIWGFRSPYIKDEDIKQFIIELNINPDLGVENAINILLHNPEIDDYLYMRAPTRYEKDARELSMIGFGDVSFMYTSKITAHEFSKRHNVLKGRM